MTNPIEQPAGTQSAQAETAGPQAAKAKAKSAWGAWLLKIVYGALAVMGILLAIGRIYDATHLPGCDSRRTRDTLRSMLQGKDILGPTYSETREVSSDPNEINCAALLTAADGRTFDLTYRIAKQDDGKTMVSAEWRPR